MSGRMKPQPRIHCGEVYINPARHPHPESDRFFREHLPHELYMGLEHETPYRLDVTDYPYTPREPKHLFIQDDRIGFGVGRRIDTDLVWDPELSRHVEKTEGNMTTKHEVSYRWWGKIVGNKIVL